MSMMCSMGGCKEKSGMCGHEKLMFLMVIAVAAFFVYRHFA